VAYKYVTPLSTFDQIISIDGFYAWAHNVLIPATRANWYNDHRALDMRGFIMDKTSFILGYTIVRQVRAARINTCTLESADLSAYFDHCISADYVLDTANYSAGRTIT
jgi:hypothetical protein